MRDVTRFLQRIERGDAAGAEEPLPLVDDELRTLAAARIRHESKHRALQAPACVHGPHLRNADGGQAHDGHGRGLLGGSMARTVRRTLLEIAGVCPFNDEPTRRLP